MPQSRTRLEFPNLAASPQIVHSIPGRVRLRLHPADASRGAEVARALLARPGVTKVAWSLRTRSLTVQFDHRRQLGDVIASLRAGRPSETTAAIAGSTADGFNWARVLLACALAFVPVGLFGGLVIALISSVIEESQRDSRVVRPAPEPRGRFQAELAG